MRLGPGVVIAERYVVERRVGTGAMGEVWAGTRLADGLPVALKVLLTVAASDQESIARFRREAEVLARVRSEYVSQVLDFLTDPELGMTLVMELIAGDSLHVVLWREKRLPVEMMLPFAADVLHGLCDLHASGIVHRDLKPGNVVVRPMPVGRPRATLIDFGVSRIIAGADEDEVTAITRGDRVLGTLEYMAPEQILSSRAVTFTADLYALGAMMFKALVGIHVFGDRTEGKLAMAKLNQDAPPMPLERDDELAVLTVGFVARLLARRSRERFGSTEEALAEVERLLATMARAQRGRFSDDMDEAATMIVGPGDLSAALGRGASASAGLAAALSAFAPSRARPASPAPPEAAVAPGLEVEPPPSSRVPRRPPPLPAEPASSAPPPPPAAAPAESGPGLSDLDQTVAFGLFERAAPASVPRPAAPEPEVEPLGAARPASSGVMAPSSAPPLSDRAAERPLPRPRRRRRGRWRTPVVVIASLTLGIVGGGFFSRSYAEGGPAARWVEQLRTLLAGDSAGPLPRGALPAPSASSVAAPVELAAAESAQPAAWATSSAEPSAEPSARVAGSTVELAPAPRPRPWRPAPGLRQPGPGSSVASTAAATAAPASATAAAAPTAATAAPPPAPTAGPARPPMPTGW